MLSNEQLNGAIARLVERLQPERFFFSAATRGKAREDSDIDLFVVAETELPLRKRFLNSPFVGRLSRRLRRLLENSGRVPPLAKGGQPRGVLCRKVRKSRL